MMGGDSRIDSVRWNGENEDDRSRTDPIEWSMHLLLFVSELRAMSDISTQLLFDEYDNEQPLERLLK